MEDAHLPSEEDEEGHHELQEVVAEGLEAVEPPWGVVQEVGHGVGHRLRLWDERRPVSCAWRWGPALPGPALWCPLVAFWGSGVHGATLAGRGAGKTGGVAHPPAAHTSPGWGMVGGHGSRPSLFAWLPVILTLTPSRGP